MHGGCRSRLPRRRHRFGVDVPLGRSAPSGCWTTGKPAAPDRISALPHGDRGSSDTYRSRPGGARRPGEPLGRSSPHARHGRRRSRVSPAADRVGSADPVPRSQSDRHVTSPRGRARRDRSPSAVPPCRSVGLVVACVGDAVAAVTAPPPHLAPIHRGNPVRLPALLAAFRPVVRTSATRTAAGRPGTGRRRARRARASDRKPGGSSPPRPWPLAGPTTVAVPMPDLQCSLLSTPCGVDLASADMAGLPSTRCSSSSTATSHRRADGGVVNDRRRPNRFVASA